MITLSCGLIITDADIANLKSVIGGGVVPIVTIPPVPPIIVPSPTPVPQSTLPPGFVDKGVLALDGSRFVIDPVDSSKIYVMTINVPNQKFANKSYISVFEYQAPVTKYTVWLSKVKADPVVAKAPYGLVGMGVNLYYSIGTSVPNVALLGSGETWYLHIKSDQECAIKAYPPT